MTPERHLVTPDRRYFVVHGRLWRMSDPRLSPENRNELVKELMAARRAVAQALRHNNASELARARRRVDHAKVALGERGPVWWSDGPDYNRRLARNTPYAIWFAKAGREEQNTAPGSRKGGRSS